MRLAKVTDRAAVIGVSYAEYFINDFMPVVSVDWIHQKNTFIYLLEHHGKIVSQTFTDHSFYHFIYLFGQNKVEFNKETM